MAKPVSGKGKSRKPKSPKRSTSRRVTKPTKNETVEQSSGVQLLLGNMAPDKDASYNYETLLGLIAKSRTAASNVTEHKKKMKEAGFDVEAFMHAMKLERADPLDLASYLKELQRLARLRGMPVQIGLFEPKYGSVEEQAKAEGWAAGKAGRTPDTQRWPEGSPGHTDYMRRWNDAQAEAAESLAKKDE